LHQRHARTGEDEQPDRGCEHRATVIDAPVDGFSGGERSRLLLAREFATPSNLLVLDEPTNDLDMETLDLLEDVLDGYAGTVLLVSHDRAFLDRVVTMVVALDGEGNAETVVGGWSDWAAQQQDAQKARSAAAREAKAKAAATGISAAAAGDSYLGEGNYAKAAELYKVALAKGVTKVEEVNTRLGIAYALQRDDANARAAFAQVKSSPRNQIAAFWIVWLDLGATVPTS
jgi:ATPase subunit of ABC transporter with duplicated ATPase domains